MLFSMRGNPAYFSDVDFLQTLNCDKGFYVLLNKNSKCGFFYVPVALDIRRMLRKMTCAVRMSV